jgi:hypothetical protein
MKEIVEALSVDSVLEPTMASVAKRALMREEGTQRAIDGQEAASIQRVGPECPVWETAALIPVNSWPA